LNSDDTAISRSEGGRLPQDVIDFEERLKPFRDASLARAIETQEHIVESASRMIDAVLLAGTFEGVGSGLGNYFSSIYHDERPSVTFQVAFHAGVIAARIEVIDPSQFEYRSQLGPNTRID